MSTNSFGMTRGQRGSRKLDRDHAKQGYPALVSKNVASDWGMRQATDREIRVRSLGKAVSGLRRAAEKKLFACSMTQKAQNDLPKTLVSG